MGAVLIVIRDPAANDSGQDERENDFQKLEQLSTDSGMFWLFVGPSHKAPTLHFYRVTLNSPRLRLFSVVFSQKFAHTVVRERRHAMIIASSHIVIIDQSVYDCFLGCLHHRSKNWVH